MMKMLRAVTALPLAALAIALVGQVGPAHAGSSNDTGALDIKPSQAAHATCAKAARDLIQTSSHDAYMRATAFTRIRRVHLLATNVSSTTVLPSGAPVVSTDVVRCIGKAQRKGTRGAATIRYAITLAPDMVAMLDSGADLATALPPPPTFSLTYATGTAPLW